MPVKIRKIRRLGATQHRDTSWEPLLSGRGGPTAGAPSPHHSRPAPNRCKVGSFPGTWGGFWREKRNSLEALVPHHSLLSGPVLSCYLVGSLSWEPGMGLVGEEELLWSPRSSERRVCSALLPSRIFAPWERGEGLGGKGGTSAGAPGPHRSWLAQFYY